MSAELDDDSAEVRELKERANEVLRRFGIAGMPELVYHYTSLDTAVKILSNFVVRLVNTAYMNDPTEGVHGEGVIDRILDNDRELCLRGARRLIREDLGSHASCFCSEADLLSQWRGYCRNGRGLAIGMDSAVLAERDHVAFSKVIYDVPTQEALVRELLEVFRAPINSARGDEQRQADLVGAIALGLVMVRTILKNPAYEPEHEYRLFDVLPNDPGERDTALQHFERGGRQVPYFPVDIRHSRAALALQPVRRVIVGPCLDFDSTSRTLRETQACRVEPFEIVRSTVPMRCE